MCVHVCVVTGPVVLGLVSLVVVALVFVRLSVPALWFTVALRSCPVLAKIPVDFWPRLDKNEAQRCGSPLRFVLVQSWPEIYRYFGFIGLSDEI